MTRGSLPGGFARISMPDSSQSIVPSSSGKQVEIRASSTEEAAEHALRSREVLANTVERLFETDPRRGVEPFDEVAEQDAGGIDVLELGRKVLVPHFEFLQLVDGVEIDVAEPLDLDPKRLGLLDRRGAVEGDRLLRATGSSAAASRRLVRIDAEFLQHRIPRAPPA